MSSQPGSNTNNGYGSNHGGGAPQSSYGLGQSSQAMSYLCAGE